MPLKKKVANKSVPSLEIVDLYRTYLHKAMPKYTAKDFAAGELIPVDQVEKDITILESKISQYQKFGFTSDKEQDQLKVLESYKEKVKGKHWPTLQEAAKASVCPHKNPTSFQTATGVSMLKCMACTKVWNPNGGTYYQGLKTNLPTIQALKNKIPTLAMLSYTPVDEEPKGITLSAGKAQIDQKFIMQMGMMSNCNVSIAMSATNIFTDDTMLYCGKCKLKSTIPTSLLVSKDDGLPSKIMEFCNAHKHDAMLVEKGGRGFREENE